MHLFSKVVRADRHLLDQPGQEDAVFGEMCRLLAVTERRTFRLSSVHDWLQPPIQLGQFARFIDRHENAFGYVTWAFLGDETSSEFLLTGPRPLHISEWNEGVNTWLIDFVCLHKRHIGECARGTLAMFSERLTLRRWRAGRGVLACDLTEFGTICRPVVNR